MAGDGFVDKEMRNVKEIDFWELEKDVAGNTFLKMRNMKKEETVNCK